MEQLAPWPIQPAIDYIDKDGFSRQCRNRADARQRGVFLGGRVGGRGWQFPQGGVNRGEQVEEALFRELKEEIGWSRGTWRCWVRPEAGCGIACRGNMCATAASDRSSAGSC